VQTGGGDPDFLKPILLLPEVVVIPKRASTLIVMPDLIRHPEMQGLQTALDSRLRGNDKAAIEINLRLWDRSLQFKRSILNSPAEHTPNCAY